ncbi:Pao retrotransposon peptidase [Popillia japonica]|uniref:Pao retrotransposon peptidase n=1 Tax=Popillia japonica TaxID=7064 RepID=A0AAW1KGX9_POPJA
MFVSEKSENNESISEIQKFHYLRAALEGSAIQAIRSLEFTVTNYAVAWNALLDRYDNKNLLIHNHVKELFDIEPLPKESPEGLRKIIDTLSKNLRALEKFHYLRAALEGSAIQAIRSLEFTVTNYAVAWNALLDRPYIINAKILLQQLWLEKVTWDEGLPLHIHSYWTKFRSKLSSLNDLCINRHVCCKDQKYIELHGFSDASEKAYGACIYLRTIDRTGKIFVSLLCSKTKVAPLKKITLPRLELAGALILAVLADKVTKALRLKISWI